MPRPKATPKRHPKPTMSQAEYTQCQVCGRGLPLGSAASCEGCLFGGLDANAETSHQLQEYARVALFAGKCESAFDNAHIKCAFCGGLVPSATMLFIMAPKSHSQLAFCHATHLMQHMQYAARILERIVRGVDVPRRVEQCMHDYGLVTIGPASSAPAPGALPPREPEPGCNGPAEEALPPASPPAVPAEH